MRSGKPQPWLIIALAILVIFNLSLLVILRDELFPTLARTDRGSGTSSVSGTPESTAVPSITPSPLPSPTPTEPPPIPYTIQAGDTLWGIAQSHSTTVDAILAANPGIDPGGLISEGEAILIPVGTSPAAEIPDSQWAHTAQVTIEGGGLRLRQQPSLEAEVIAILAALTPLTAVGRTSNSTWIEVRTPFLEYGWVSAEWLELYIDMADIPIIWRPDVSPQVDDPSAADTPTAAPPEGYAYVSGLTDHLRQIYQLGQSLGNGENVFSKVGDSITVNSGFMTPFGTRHYVLHEYSYLQPAIEHYESGWARTHNPFANVSLAAAVGWSSVHVLQSGMANSEYCEEGETPLECEYRLVNPSLAIVMLGTNDVPGMTSEMVESALREIIEISLEKGIIPVITTIPPMHRAGMAQRVMAFNAILTDLAAEYQVPLVDYWSALLQLPNQGIGSDGVHPTNAPGSDDGDLSEENLRYGIPMRNLVTLQALDAIWRYLTQPE